MNDNPYYTHRKYLVNILNSFNYDQQITCFEFGIGYGSSEIFHEYCQKFPNLKVYGFETDNVWFLEISEKFNRTNYSFTHLDNWNNFNYESLSESHLTFIDQAPWEARLETLENMSKKSKNILIHDYDYFNKGKIDNIFDVSEKSFLGRYVDAFDIQPYHEILPPTVVLSRKSDDH
jgi:hypothetical protein